MDQINIDYALNVCSEAFHAYEKVFIDTLYKVQCSLFGHDKMEFFIGKMGMYDDWEKQAQESFERMGITWDEGWLVYECKSYEKWINEEIEQFTSCACQGSGCNACLC